jgi:putative ATP-dependent endonuclease of the OLD family
LEIKQVTIENFRGIKQMTWILERNMCCIIGPGDSTKTTILDAIEFALSPRWIIQFTDMDFYNGEIDKPIKITITIAKPPQNLLAEDKFGLMIRGWHPAKGLTDEPEDENEIALTVQLIVDNSLEPQWKIINDREKEGRRIGWKDRQLLGVTRLGVEIDRHLSWGRGSALLRIANINDDIAGALAETNRKSREIFRDISGTSLKKSAYNAQEEAKLMGVLPNDEFLPGLDTRFIYTGAGAISLFDGAIPLRMAGLGTRKLVALALEKASIPEGAIILIDEIEYGLEPHRIRNLLSVLRDLTATRSGTGNNNSLGQVIMTSHSPIVIQELKAVNLGVVRSISGATNIINIDNSLQGIVRKESEALLSKKILVCEGKTEIGICFAFKDIWVEKHNGLRPSCVGLSCVDGNGSESPQKAHNLKRLGYDVALFCDSDRGISPSQNTLEQEGIKTFLWSNNCSTEERIFKDLPWKSLKDVVNLALDFKGFDIVVNAINNQLVAESHKLDRGLTNWSDLEQIPNIKEIIGKISKDKEWFKRPIDDCRLLGKIIVKTIPDIPNSDIVRLFSALEQWIYE